MDITLIRILLQQLCKQPVGDEADMSAKAVFDWGTAPGYDGQREVVRAHNELLVGKGFSTVERIHSRSHQDFAVLMPTQLGKTWCRFALDDEQWEQRSAELRALLTS